MCTVTLRRIGEHIYLTQNRDEARLRERATPPSIHDIDGQNWIYPVDPQSGGTWFAVSETQPRSYALMNGAETKHQHRPPYRKSRGLVLLDLMRSSDAETFFKSEDLSGIEPFSVIAVEGDSYLLYRWDGSQVKKMPLSLDQEIILSSSTLYDPEMQAQRQAYYESVSPEIQTWDDIIAFHQTSEIEGAEGIIIDREVVATQNIISAQLDSSGHLLDYHYFTTE